jgi:DNA-binding MarR family transcriptional regulator
MNERPPESLTRVLKTLGRIETCLEDALEPLGLSLAKLGALAQLVEAGEPLPLRALAERCACVRSNITQLVDRLEADGLVVRVDDPHDRRSIRAQLTDEGRGRHAAGIAAMDQAERALFAPLSERQRQSLFELLEMLSATVN